MAYGVRTWMPLGLGLVAGSLLAVLLFSSEPLEPEQQRDQPDYVQVSEHWTVNVLKPSPPLPAGQAAPNKVSGAGGAPRARRRWSGPASPPPSWACASG